ncbi:hypothetical protein ACWD4P_18230 [Kitasatospora sp. NPDC002543]
MMDPVTLLLLGTTPAVLKVADALARSLLLRARADLTRAQTQAQTRTRARCARQTGNGAGNRAGNGPAGGER